MIKLFNFLTITGISLSVIMPVNVQAARVPILDNQQLQEYLTITQLNFSILTRMNSTTTPVRHIDNRGKYLQFPALSAVSRGFSRTTQGISMTSHRQKSLHDRPSNQHQLFDPPPELAEATLDISSPQAYHGIGSGHDTPSQSTNQRFIPGSSAGASTYTPLSKSDNTSKLDLEIVEMISQPEINNSRPENGFSPANKPCCLKTPESENIAPVPEPTPISLILTTFLLLTAWQWLTVRKKQGQNRTI